MNTQKGDSSGREYEDNLLCYLGEMHLIYETAIPSSARVKQDEF